MKAFTNIRIRVDSKQHDATSLCMIENRTVSIVIFFSQKVCCTNLHKPNPGFNKLVTRLLVIIDIKVHWFFEKVFGKTKGEMSFPISDKRDI